MADEDLSIVEVKVTAVSSASKSAMNEGNSLGAGLSPLIKRSVGKQSQ